MTCEECGDPKRIKPEVLTRSAFIELLRQLTDRAIDAGLRATLSDSPAAELASRLEHWSALHGSSLVFQ